MIGRLYERHHRMVRALCQLLLRNATDAEDAAQQTFLSAFASLIDGTIPRNAAAWLATIARRECWARTAQRRRQPLQLDDTDADPHTSSALDEAIRNADLAALWQAINALPRQQRAAFLLREFSGLSYAEVAAALGASESAVETLLVRARRQLRDGLQPALKTANLIATALLLLRRRFVRLLDPRLAGGTVGKAAATSATIKLGAAVTGVLVVVAGSVDVGIHTIGRHSGVGAVSPTDPPSARPGALEQSGRRPAAGPIPTDRLLGRNQVRLAALATPGSRVETTGSPVNANTAPGSTTGEPETTGSATDGSPGGSATTSEGSTTATTDAQPPTASTGSTDTSGDTNQPTTSSSGEATPADTTPTDIASADTNPVDTIPTDTTPAEQTQKSSDENPVEPSQPNTPAAP